MIVRAWNNGRGVSVTHVVGEAWVVYEFEKMDCWMKVFLN
jgi:hypothetical protein